MKTKITKIDKDEVHFDNGMILSSDHDQSCCESHYLDFSNVAKEDYVNLEFDLSTDSFFKRIPDYGIELIPIRGHSIRVPGYGYNNGYYGSNIDLILKDIKNKSERKFDVSDCQIIEG